jgi:hypothetical protein
MKKTNIHAYPQGTLHGYFPKCLVGALFVGIKMFSKYMKLITIRTGEGIREVGYGNFVNQIRGSNAINNI